MQRLVEVITRAPRPEDKVAISNIALDLIGHAQGRVLPRGVYDRLRQRTGLDAGRPRKSPRVRPGCVSPQVLLAADPDDPILFDHAVDHVPGMVLMEAVLELVALDDAAPVIGLTAMDSFVEFDRPCRLVPQRVGSGISVALEQEGLVRGVVTVCLAPRPTPASIVLREHMAGRWDPVILPVRPLFGLTSLDRF